MLYVEVKNSLKPMQKPLGEGNIEVGEIITSTDTVFSIRMKNGEDEVGEVIFESVQEQ